MSEAEARKVATHHLEREACLLSDISAYGTG